MNTIDLIAGARPNFMKIAPIIAAANRPRNRTSAHGFASTVSPFRYRLIHTGQHYDKSMSSDFFEQLGIPEPDINLAVGSGSQAEQTAAIMTRYEKILIEKRCDLCVVVGDVTSTMACTIVAKKLCIPVAHVEGGIRSGDMTMPEEINRIVTDSIADYFFTTSEIANENLRRIGVTDDRIFFVGNTMIDTLLKHMPRFQPPPVWDQQGLQPKAYFILTLHRPANVDNGKKLLALLEAIASGTRGLPVVFPVHPRTRQKLSGFLPLNQNSSLLLIEPQPYLQFNYLVKHSKAVITDSGGITEETTVMSIPCMTLRDSTERPETVTVGTNMLLGTDPRQIAPAMECLFAGKWKSGQIPAKWDGLAGERIVNKIDELLNHLAN
jgi:UDP-N-acetylglucosamine 2-epimerase (non-hydrolysing)